MYHLGRLGRLGFGGGGGASTETPLRTIAVNNRMHNSSESHATYKNYCFRTPYLVGQDSKNIGFLLKHWYFSSAGMVTPNYNLTYDDLSLESPSGVIIPVTIDGGRSYTLSPLERKYTDFLLPSDFSLSGIEKATSLTTSVWWLKGRISVPVATKAIPYNNNTSRNDFTGSQCAFYDPATAGLSSTDVAGVYTGTGLYNRSGMHTPIMVGNPVVDTMSWVHVGDSIGGGNSDTDNDVVGKSYFNRALGDLSSGLLAGINLSTGGTNSTHYMGNAYVKELYELARGGICNHAANDIGTTTVLATLKTQHQAIYDDMAAAGLEVRLAIEPFVRTNSSDQWLTSVGQTAYNMAWASGATADQFRDWLPTQVGTYFDEVVSTLSVRDATDTWKWKTDGITIKKWASDNVHPAYQANVDMAAVLGPILRAY